MGTDAMGRMRGTTSAREEGTVHGMWGEPRSNIAGAIDRVWMLERLLLEGPGRRMGPRARQGGVVETRRHTRGVIGVCHAPNPRLLSRRFGAQGLPHAQGNRPFSGCPIPRSDTAKVTSAHARHGGVQGPQEGKTMVQLSKYGLPMRRSRGKKAKEMTCDEVSGKGNHCTKRGKGMKHCDMVIHSPTITLPLQLASPLYQGTMHNIQNYTKTSPNNSL